jgi:hypothetical protein
MGLMKNIFSSFQGDKNEKQESKIGLSIERIAEHEAAHGIVWCLFRKNWNVNQLTIERDNLPDEGMDGALHITANFQESNEPPIERANELSAIALAGLIGQNMNLIKQRDSLLFEMTQVINYSSLLDTRGCGGDFDIVRRFSAGLGQEFGVNEGSYIKYKIMDLISLFQNDSKVQYIHETLSNLLLEKKTLQKDELLSFFEMHNFIEYIFDEGLDINFFHQRR